MFLQKQQKMKIQCNKVYVYCPAQRTVKDPEGLCNGERVMMIIDIQMPKNPCTCVAEDCIHVILQDSNRFSCSGKKIKTWQCISPFIN